MAAHALLDLEPLLLDPWPCVRDLPDIDVGAAQPVIAVSYIFIVNTAFELEPRRGDVGDYPLAVPLRVDVPLDGRSAKGKDGILLWMSSG